MTQTSKPSGYERATFTGIINKYWLFCARSLTNVRVLVAAFRWLSIGWVGELFVGRPSQGHHEKLPVIFVNSVSGRAFGPARRSDRAECDGSPLETIS